MKNLKKVLCSVLALVMMASLCLIPASAAGDVGVTSVDLNYDIQWLAVGQSEDIYVTVTPSDCTIKGVSWTTSDPSILTFAKGGATMTSKSTTCTVKGVSEGFCYITVIVESTDGSKASDRELLHVTKRTAVSSVSVSPSNMTMKQGESRTLTSSVSPSDATDPSVTWSSSNSAVAVVDENGQVTAIAPGSCNITATSNDDKTKSATCVVTVSADQTQDTYYFVKKSDGNWYYVKGSYVTKNGSTTYQTTVMENYTGARPGYVNGEYGWWRIDGGKVILNCNTIEQNEHGWWKFKNGKVDFSYNSIAQNRYGWWKCTNGKVTFKENEIYQNEHGWWKCTNSKVTFQETGVYHNKHGWWYCENSKVQFDYNGLASNQFGTWVIKNGKVNFDYNGKYYWNGNTYNVKNGKVV